ncbi:hypothetical protein ONS96_003560 [Cadophora gregata f. sp. sojae]|nr:hypothetical protein ONS96_003560 [Cadophora gregata f. sp. sojae]
MSVTDESAKTSATPKPSYRRPVQVKAEVKEHCHIYLDEQIYSTALTLLNDLVVTGASHPEHQDRPTVVPDPHHIELACALLIHPRPTSQEATNVSLPSQSILFLRNVLIHQGSRNANLGEAFSFSSLVNNRKSRSNRIRHEDRSSGSDTEDKQGQVNGIVANNGRMRRCARDFWHMVGWAFNCSVRFPRRWNLWKVWLDFMLDVLEHDWTEREQEDLAEDDCWKLRRQSLLVKYLADAVNKSHAVKRIVRSAFADGDAESLKDFPEVFFNETRKPRYGQKRKRDDPLGEMFGSYNNEDEAEFESDNTPESSQEADEIENMSGKIWLGDMESTALRQRVIMLLSRVSAYLPECFADCVDVYDEIYQCTVRLPLPAFTQFTSTADSSQMPSFVFVTLAQLLLVRLLPLSAPRPQTIEDRSDDGVTQVMLERCFLPFASSNTSVADNARVSILAENFFRCLVKTGGCEFTQSLKAAVEKGIMARENKIKGDRRRREPEPRNKTEEGELFALKASGQRMRCLLAVLKQYRAD